MRLDASFLRCNPLQHRHRVFVSSVTRSSPRQKHKVGPAPFLATGNKKKKIKFKKKVILFFILFPGRSLRKEKITPSGEYF